MKGVKRQAELALTAGKVFLGIGAVLAIVPAILLLPGLVFLAIGWSCWQTGENLWNAAHGLPCRWKVPEIFAAKIFDDLDNVK